MSKRSIAVDRFGYGLRSGEAMPADPHGWLIAQFAAYRPAPSAIAKAPSSASVAGELATYFATIRAAGPMGGKQPATTMTTMPAVMPATAAAAAPPSEGTPVTPVKKQRSPAVLAAAQDARLAGRGDYGDLVAARTVTVLQSDTPFVERLVHFWANHFAVSADKLELVGLSGTLEMEAIRPHVLGRFSDMLNAVERHPAMLLYLDQAVSVGPDSPIGRRIAARGVRKAGLNENLAREILELHTLGVRTGYSQADVTEFARALTGWTVGGIGRGPVQRLTGERTPGTFVFVDALHEPGPRTIVGRRYAADGEAQAQAVLTDLAASPATATHLATKLARHFAGDMPPAAMVARLQAAYLASGGDLPTVYRAIVASPEAWVEQPVKFKTPWEWSVSAMRALGTKDVAPGVMVGLMNQLGQPVWKPGQPVGYDDIAASWAGPDALMRRVEAASRFAAQAPETDARRLAATLYPDSAATGTTQALARAESPGQALALLLASPEMMRR